MARRVQGQPLRAAFALLSLFLTPPAHAGALASYSFDDAHIESGPDTFRVFEYGKGSVTLSGRYHWSGYQAVEIREEPHDGDFAELQGYFEKRESGRLYFHFAFLVATPGEELNVALAGPSCFALKQHGIAFWLSTREGWLYQNSDSMPKKLFELRAFTWYGVDVRYDIPKGTYDLVIQQEGKAEPLVQLKTQANATKQPMSFVDKFSFIGDLADRSSVNYYVDDIVVGVDGETPEIAFAAPGRKKLFVDAWSDARKAAAGRIVCPSSYQLADFGISRSDQAELKKLGAISKLQAVLIDPSPGVPPSTSNERADAILASASSWVQGCRQLERGSFEPALQEFDRSLKRVPRARIVELSRALALAGLKRWEEMEHLLVHIGADWRDDPRYAIALAQVSIARPNLDRVTRTLDSWSIEHLAEATLTRREMQVEAYFDLLLWQNKCQEAEEFALKVASRLKLAAPKSPNRGLWLLHAGDAAFVCGNPSHALTLYQDSLQAGAPEHLVFTRLSDACFRLGDPAREREYREKLYGSLREDKARK